MALRKIVVELNPNLQDKTVLHTVCRDIVNFDDKLNILIEDMIETLHKTKDAVGLAAPQIGILKKVAVIDIGQGPIVLINPEIIEKKGKDVGVEGCLSYPNVWAEVERPKFVKVKTFDKEGKLSLLECADFAARAFCHEIDHLNGVVFLDRAKTRINKQQLDEFMKDSHNFNNSNNSDANSNEAT